MDQRLAIIADAQAIDESSGRHAFVQFLFSLTSCPFMLLEYI